MKMASRKKKNKGIGLLFLILLVIIIYKGGIGLQAIVAPNINVGETISIYARADTCTPSADDCIGELFITFPGVGEQSQGTKPLETTCVGASCNLDDTWQSTISVTGTYPVRVVYTNCACYSQTEETSSFEVTAEVCQPNSFRCTGAGYLDRCNADGTDWEYNNDCDSYSGYTDECIAEFGDLISEVCKSVGCTLDSDCSSDRICYNNECCLTYCWGSDYHQIGELCTNSVIEDCGTRWCDLIYGSAIYQCVDCRTDSDCTGTDVCDINTKTCVPSGTCDNDGNCDAGETLADCPNDCTCDDSDGGDVRNSQGTVIVGTQTIGTDYCVDSNTVHEYMCSSSYPYWVVSDRNCVGTDTCLTGAGACSGVNQCTDHEGISRPIGYIYCRYTYPQTEYSYECLASGQWSSESCPADCNDATGECNTGECHYPTYKNEICQNSIILKYDYCASDRYWDIGLTRDCSAEDKVCQDGQCKVVDDENNVTITDAYCLSQCSTNGKCKANEKKTKCISSCAFFQKWEKDEFDGSDSESGCVTDTGIIILIIVGLFAFKMFKGP